MNEKKEKGKANWKKGIEREEKKGMKKVTTRKEKVDWGTNTFQKGVGGMIKFQNIYSWHPPS